MIGKPLTLRTQLALAMAFCVVASVLFGYGGLTVFGEWQTGAYVAKLSPKARRAYNDYLRNRTPDPKDLMVLKEEADVINARADAEQSWVLVALTFMAMGTGVCASLFMAARLSKPLEDVAKAARLVANGDLTARATLSVKGSSETSGLVGDFNLMANALQSFQQELNESSAAIAHELRTPLTVLRGRLQGMYDGLFTAGPQEILGLIRQIDALGRIVEDLQMVSLAASGALELRKSAIDLAVEVDVLMQTLQPDLHNAGLMVELDLRPAPVLADPSRIRQATLALLDNARRHAGQGRSVRVETMLCGPEAVIRVLDRGPGLTPLALERVFDRFWRAEESRSRAGGGSGLGLSVVAAIANAHGGSARAKLREGGGAVFELAVPTS